MTEVKTVTVLDTLGNEIVHKCEDINEIENYTLMYQLDAENGFLVVNENMGETITYYLLNNLISFDIGS